MGITTMALSITGGICAIGIASLWFLRQKVRSKWVDLRKYQVDLAGKVIVITGGNVGLGYETALDLAGRNAIVVIACRDLSKGFAAVHRIISSTNNHNVHCMHLDLASMESIKIFAKNVKEKFTSIYALVCNAGVWMPMDRGEKTKDGFEVHFGVNHLGHFLLISSLLDCLRKSESRVVIVSSGLLSNGQLDMDTMEFLNGRKVKPGEKSGHAPTGYSDSKLMNYLCCKELAERLQGSSVTTYCVCPGWCYTELARNVSIGFLAKLAMLPIAFMFMRSPRQGAQNIVFATVKDKEELISGGFYRDGRVVDVPCPRYRDNVDELALKLWELSEKLVDVQ